MSIIAQKDKEWMSSHHPCLPATYSLLLPHAISAPLSYAPHYVTKVSLTRLRFSATSPLFIPSPWCSPLAFIAAMNESLPASGIACAMTRVKPMSPFLLYSCAVAWGIMCCIPLLICLYWWWSKMIPCPDPMSIYSWFPVVSLTRRLTPKRQKLCLF